MHVLAELAAGDGRCAHEPAEVKPIDGGLQLGTSQPAQSVTVVTGERIKVQACHVPIWSVELRQGSLVASEHGRPAGM